MKSSPLTFLFLIWAVIACGVEVPREGERLPDFDRRLGAPQTAAAAPVARDQAARTLRERVATVEIVSDPITQTPRWIGSTTQLLTGAVSHQTAAAFPADDHHGAVKAFLNEHRELFGHDATVLAGAKITREDRSPSGLRTVVWQQAISDIPVFEGILKAALTARGELINVGSQFVAVAEKARAAPAPVIAARRAVALAALATGAEVAEAGILAKSEPVGAMSEQRFDAPGLHEPRAKLTWLPLNATSVRLCWNVLLTQQARGEMFQLLVDAESGEVLLRRCLTEHVSEASYRVFPSDSPRPMSPGLALPESTQAPEVSRTLVTTPALNLTASPNGWIDDGVNETRGNNVDAHLDLNRDNLPDTPRPQGSPTRVFDFPLDLTLAPNTYRDATVTNLFYWCNFLHDRYYALGFTEAAGNFQINNFGRGGAGADAVLAQAQDGGGLNNANFSTPPDGIPGRMQVYIFDGPTPDRDAALDAELIIHEYTHGLTNRLVGGGAGLRELQSRGMGEGWSDFYGLAVLSEAGDDVDGTYPFGAYVAYGRGGTVSENYYFGIRRYPYTTDLRKNPLTFRDIDPTQARQHPGIPIHPRFDATTSDPSLVHRQGEVWCSTLWEVRAALVKKLGFPAGNELTLQLVTDGLKLSPYNPTFLQARNAILQAEMIGSGGAHAREIWAAFAKRGMGVSAVAPPSFTTTGVVENFDVPDSLRVFPLISLEARGDLGGPFTPNAQSYTLTNTGSAPLAWTATKTQPWLTLDGATSGTLAPGASMEVVVTINAAAAALGLGEIADTVTFRNSASGANLLRHVNLAVDPPRLHFEPLDRDPGWAREGEWAFGRPTGQGAFAGVPPGAPDPTSGATGANVFGINLAGRYTVRGGPFYLTTRTLDCRGWQNTKLQFQRWLNVGTASEATIEVSNNGTTWTSIWNTGTVAVIDSTWRRMRFDISALADNQPTVFIRWGHTNNTSLETYSGWNLDDIEILGTPNNLTLLLPPSVREGAASATATVFANPAPSADLVVTLTSNLPARLNLPASVTIPAGATRADFPLTAIDDALLNGSPEVTVTPSAAGQAGHAKSLVVEDNERATVSVVLPWTTTEGLEAVTGQVLVSAPPVSDVLVRLVSSAPDDALPPPTVRIPAGQTSAPFPLLIFDDRELDGTQWVSITPTVANWESTAGVIVIFDNEQPTLTLTIEGNVFERRSIVGTVRISGLLPSDLVVALASDATSELTVPASVIIPAGQTSVIFRAQGVDDTLTDGAQNVHLTASASGFAPASAVVVVRDDDVHHYTFSPLASPQIPGVPFLATIAAKDVNDETITNYRSFGETLSAASGVNPPAISPSRVFFADGVWMGLVTLHDRGSQVALGVTDESGHFGTSDPIEVGTGPLHHFAWEPMASPRSVGVSFLTALRAVDQGGNPIEDFSGAALLSADRHTVRFIGTYTTSATFLFTKNHPATRAQTIYPASALGGPGRLTALSLEVPNGIFSGWTIRLKHTSRTEFAAADWDLDGWTTVHASDAIVPNRGVITFPFRTRFDYDGTSNLMIDLSAREGTVLDSFPRTPASASAGWRAVTGYSDLAGSDPLAWRNDAANIRERNNLALVLQLTTAEPVALLPSAAVSFVDGVWTGNIALGAPGERIVVRAENGAGIFGESNPLVIDTADLDGDNLPDAWVAQYGVQGVYEDPDHDGLGNFLEYALGLDPTTPDALPAPEKVTVIDDGDTDIYLVWTYRRLLVPRTLIYVPEVSLDFVTWYNGIQQVSAVPNADGITETVTVRIRVWSSGSDDPPPYFLRLRITAP